VAVGSGSLVAVGAAVFVASGVGDGSGVAVGPSVGVADGVGASVGVPVDVAAGVVVASALVPTTVGLGVGLDTGVRAVGSIRKPRT